MKLAKREKYFVSIAVSVIVVFFFLQFAILPFIEKRISMKKNIKSMEKEIKEMTLWSNEYRTLKQAPQNIQKLLSGRKMGFTLFSFWSGDENPDIIQSTAMTRSAPQTQNLFEIPFSENIVTFSRTQTLSFSDQLRDHYRANQAHGQDTKNRALNLSKKHQQIETIIRQLMSLL